MNNHKEHIQYGVYVLTISLDPEYITRATKTLVATAREGETKDIRDHLHGVVMKELRRLAK